MRLLLIAVRAVQSLSFARSRLSSSCGARRANPSSISSSSSRPAARACSASRWRFAPAFYRRIDEVILPSFAALGVPAYEAWALRHEAAATAAREA